MGARQEAQQGRGLGARATAGLVTPIVGQTGAAASNVATIQAALSAGGTVRLRGSGTVYINATLLIGSNTRLVLDPGLTLKQTNGTRNYLIENADQVNGNSNISIEGGTIDINGTNNTSVGVWPAWNGSGVLLIRCTGVLIRNIKGVDSPKFVWQLAGCSDVIVENLTFNTTSDGVHVNGPASNVRVSGVSGYCGDDMVAFCCNEYPSSLTIAAGNISEVVVEKIRGVSTGKALVKLLAGAGVNLRRATVRDIKGSTVGSSAVVCNEDAGQANTTGRDLSEISIADVDCSTPVGYAAIQAGGVAGSVYAIDNLFIRAGGLNCAGVMAYGVLESLSLSRLATDSGYIGNVIDNSNAATITDLVVRDCVANFANGSGRVLYTTGVITRAEVSNLVSKVGAQGAFTLGTGGSIPDLYVSNAHIKSAYYLLNHGGAATVNLHLANVTIEGAQICVTNLTGAGGVYITGAGFRRIGNSSQGIARSASQVSSINCESYPVDASLLTRNAGDLCYNTNAALACGAGVLLTDGTTWKNLYSGLTY